MCGVFYQSLYSAFIVLTICTYRSRLYFSSPPVFVSLSSDQIVPSSHRAVL